VSVFADSSAVVKLYADEPGSAAIRRLEVLLVSCLARVEVPAAIWRKQRAGELTVEQADVLTAAFDLDYLGSDDEPPRFLVVGILPELLDDAALLTRAHRLRAYDAVQLASARAARAVDPSCDGFACADRSLRAAAVAEHFRLIG
jgi:predicted nucleic acid-binding protein